QNPLHLRRYRAHATKSRRQASNSKHQNAKRVHCKAPWSRSLLDPFMTAAGKSVDRKQTAALVDQLQRPAAATCHTAQRIVRDNHRPTSRLAQQTVNTAQQSTSASQHDATLGNV